MLVSQPLHRVLLVKQQRSTQEQLTAHSLMEHAAHNKTDSCSDCYRHKYMYVYTLTNMWNLKYITFFSDHKSPLVEMCQRFTKYNRALRWLTIQNFIKKESWFQGIVFIARMGLILSFLLMFQSLNMFISCYVLTGLRNTFKKLFPMKTCVNVHFGLPY